MNSLLMADLINLLMKFQLVDDFVHHFSLCSDGDTHQVQVLSFDTANGITIAKNAATFIFCHEAKSSRMTNAIFVSKSIKITLALQSSVRTSKSVLLS